MKNQFVSLIIGLALLAGVHQATAQAARFFRISGPAATTITAFNLDGTLVWSNALAGTNYTVQTASSLTGGTKWVDYVQLPVTTGVNTNLIFAFNPPAGMALIPAGVFKMGYTLDAESDAVPTNVYVSSFYMDVNLVSSNQWAAVYSYGTNHGYVFCQGITLGGLPYVAAGKAANQPVQTVDWFDCLEWSNARSQQAGLTPVYYTDAGLTQMFTNGDNGTTVFANWGANGYRLPTEAEWEKAARGGLSGQRFPWGDTISESQANYDGNTAFPYDFGPNGYNALGNYPTTSPGTSPVGSFPANGYGLNDMAGNVLEWCWDWYYGVQPYPVGSPYLGGTDPHGPVGPTDYRVARAGDWVGYSYAAECSARDYNEPYMADQNLGFRCVRAN